ncbi:MAG: hypothetical protein WBA23_13705 [Tunicatimonas sp.]|uniref:hypothetical protein n=1 Tax=Tunicatimonas sp. TaxID=1940096 RepID=UPI003C731B22
MLDFSSSRQLLISYVRELKDIKTKQIRLYTQWTDYDYSDQFNHFLSEQKEKVSQQHIALKTLIDTWKGRTSQQTHNIVPSLLYQAEQIERYSQSKSEFISVEPIIAQVLQGVIHHELAIVRGAITLARTLREPIIVGTLVNVLEGQEKAYLQLRDFETEVSVENDYNTKVT